MTNAIFDISYPSIYKAMVLEKQTGSGKTIAFHIKLSEWGPQLKSEEVQVSYSTYKDTEVGDSVNVCLNNGLFKIPYYFLVE